MADQQKNHVAIAAAARQMGQPKTNAKGDDAEVLRSLESMGLISGETSAPEHETAKQTDSSGANDAEIIASLKAMGVIGDGDGDK